MAASDMPPHYAGGQPPPPWSVSDVRARARLVLGGRGLARQVRQVLDRAHAVHAARPDRDVLPGGLVRHLTADVDHAVLRVELDVPLDVVDVLVAEQLALDLLDERRIVQALLRRRAAGAG